MCIRDSLYFALEQIEAPLATVHWAVFAVNFPWLVVPLLMLVVATKK